MSNIKVIVTLVTFQSTMYEYFQSKLHTYGYNMISDKQKWK